MDNSSLEKSFWGDLKSLEGFDQLSDKEKEGILLRYRSFLKTVLSKGESEQIDDLSNDQLLEHLKGNIAQIVSTVRGLSRDLSLSRTNTTDEVSGEPYRRSREPEVAMCKAPELSPVIIDIIKIKGRITDQPGDQKDFYRHVCRSLSLWVKERVALTQADVEWLWRGINHGESFNRLLTFYAGVMSDDMLNKLLNEARFLDSDSIVRIMSSKNASPQTRNRISEREILDHFSVYQLTPDHISLGKLADIMCLEGVNISTKNETCFGKKYLMDFEKTSAIVLAEAYCKRVRKLEQEIVDTLLDELKNTKIHFLYYEKNGYAKTKEGDVFGALTRKSKYDNFAKKPYDCNDFLRALLSHPGLSENQFNSIVEVLPSGNLDQVRLAGIQNPSASDRFLTKMSISGDLDRHEIRSLIRHPKISGDNLKQIADRAEPGDKLWLIMNHPELLSDEVFLEKLWTGTIAIENFLLRTIIRIFKMKNRRIKRKALKAGGA